MPLYEVVYVIDPISATSAYSVTARSLDEARFKIDEFLALDSELSWQVAGSLFNETIIPVDSYVVSLGLVGQYNAIIYSKRFPPEARVVVQADNQSEALILANGLPKSFVWFGLNLGAMPDYTASVSITEYAFLANLNITLNPNPPLSVGVTSSSGAISGQVSVDSLVPVDSYPTPPPPYPVVNNGDVLIRFNNQSLAVPVLNGNFATSPFVPDQAGSYPLLASYGGFIEGGINFKTAFSTSSVTVARGSVTVLSINVPNAIAGVLRGHPYVVSFFAVASQVSLAEFEIKYTDSSSNEFSLGSAEGYYNYSISSLVEIPISASLGEGTLEIIHLQNADYESSSSSIPLAVV